VAPGYGRGAEPCDLECVRARVHERFDAYTAARQQIAEYRNVANLGLFGIGTAAGVNAVTKGSKEGLQTLALTAAGIVGLDGVVKADDQYVTFSAGADALECVWQTDRKQDTALAAMGLPNLASPAPKSPKDLAATSTAPRRAATEQEALGPYLQLARGPIQQQAMAAVTTSGDAARSASATILLSEIANGRRALEANIGQSLRNVSPDDLLLLASIRHAELNAAEARIRDAFDFRLRAVNRAAFDKRADELNDALNDITEAVSARLLYSHKDLEGIYNALKSAMDKAVKPPQQSPAGSTPGGKPAGSSAGFAAVRTMRMKGTSATQVAAAELFQFAAEQAARDANAVADYADTYKVCLDKAVKKGDNPNPPNPKPGEGGGGGG
jgi:hypothetical protein